MRRTVVGLLMAGCVAAGLFAAGDVFVAAGYPLRPSLEEEQMDRQDKRLIFSTQADAPGDQISDPVWRSAWEKVVKSQRTLRAGKPEQVGLMGNYLDQMDSVIQAGIEQGLFPGAVVFVVKDGVVVKEEAYGKAYLYAGQDELLPPEQQVPISTDTLFDLASLTKVFTAVAVMQLVERGTVDLDTAVAEYLPQFSGGKRDGITIRHLLTHTSGLTAWLPLYSYPTLEKRWQAVYRAEPADTPGSTFIYSDLNMILLGKVVEQVSGLRLDEYIHQHITEPLGMENTMFNPPEHLYERIAATEAQPWTGRPMIRGTVHDENAYALGGVAGHAGLFSTAEDLAVFAQTLLNGGRYGKVRILQQETVVDMMSNQITTESHLAQSLGWNLYRGWFMDALSSPVTAGHTGFTGTSLLINPLQETVVIFLTNRVHPSRERGSINWWRQQVAHLTARAIPVKPAAGKTAWYSGNGPNLEHTLQLSLNLDEDSVLTFKTWFDIASDIPRDFGYVEISTDQGNSWALLKGELKSGKDRVPHQGIFTGSTAWQWVDASFDLSGYRGEVLIRFRYTTNEQVNGRGWYIDHVKVKGKNGYVFKDVTGDQQRWEAEGWYLSDH